MSGVETRQCINCGRVLPITEFYKNGGGYHKHECKECYRERANERKKAKLAGIPPKKRIDKAKMLKMYADGIPVPDIAKACNASEHTVRQYAAGTGIKRERADRAQVCRNCWLYPCFKGIENFETNFALTCRSWHLRGKS